MMQSMLQVIMEDKEIYTGFKQNKYEKKEMYDLIGKIKKLVLVENKNCVIVIVGKPGTGKSFASLRLAELISEGDPQRFNIDHVLFSKTDFLQFGTLEKPKGTVEIFEEAGVNYSSRKYHENSHMNAIMQTMRYQNRVLIMNVPDLDFIDKIGRKLVSAVFKMLPNIDRSRNLSKMIPYIQENDGMGNTKRGFPLMDGMLISEISVNLPSAKLRHEYDRRAKIYKDSLNHKQLEIQKLKDSLMSEEQKLAYYKRRMERRIEIKPQDAVVSDVARSKLSMIDKKREAVERALANAGV